MKKLITLALFIILLFPANRIFAQPDRYNWDIKFGVAMPTFVNIGDTKKWIERGIGGDLFLVGVGYKNIHLNLAYQYFNDLKSENQITFGSYQFIDSVIYRKVNMNLTLSYEYEMIRRLFVEPQIGWVRTHITSNAVDEQENEVTIKT